MTGYASSYEINLASASQLHLQTWAFTLFADLWDQFNLPHPLNWLRAMFDETSASQIPNDRVGVYAFVLEHEIFNLRLAYLLYVGKTTENFRARFRKYKQDQRDERHKRLLVKRMLTTWPGRLAFYYAPIDDRELVGHIEDQLIAVFKPPACSRYPATVREPFKILDTLT